MLQQEPHNAAALNNLGIARDLQDHHGDAEPAYRAALAASPDMTAAKVNLALCLAIRGQGGEAIGLLRPMADGPARPGRCGKILPPSWPWQANGWRRNASCPRTWPRTRSRRLSTAGIGPDGDWGMTR